MSFHLLGIGKLTYKDLGSTGTEQECIWCSNKVFYHLILVRTWLTYFFIPVLPYRKQYRMECPVCATGFFIYGSEIESAKLGELKLNSSATGQTDEKAEFKSKTPR
jgi:hypothetical protein